MSPHSNSPVAPKHTVLIVDDEAPIRTALRRALRGEPYEILEAEGGEAALAILRARPIHTLLVDNAMPGMSGLDFLRIARITRPDAVRIMLTGRAELDTAIRAVNEDGVFRFLCKPWDRDALRLTLRLALAQHDELQAVDRMRRAQRAEVPREHAMPAEKGSIYDVERDDRGRIVLEFDEDVLSVA